MSVQNDAPLQVIEIGARPADPPNEGATAVYRLYDAAGVLLYIGSTTNPAARWSQHKARKDWWPDVAAYALTWWPSQGQAYAEEYKAIRAEQPARNQLGVFPFWEKRPVSEEAQRVAEAIAAVEDIEDPELRARAISEVLAFQTQRAPRWRKLRRDAVLAMRGKGISYRKVATILGVSLGTVQDIEAGYTGSGRNRPRVKPAEE